MADDDVGQVTDPNKLRHDRFGTPKQPVLLSSPSLAFDGGLLALAEGSSAATEAFGDRWRLVGGMMTRLTAEVCAPDLEKLRFSQDADLGASVADLSSAPLLAVMQRRGFAKVDGSRLQKQSPQGEANVDLLVPSSDGRFHQNIRAGEFMADATPGLRAALALPPLRVSFQGRLTGGETVAADDVLLPHPVAALAIKAYAWRMLARLQDATDVSVLLRAVDAIQGDLGPVWEIDADLVAAKAHLRSAFRDKRLVRDAGWSKADIDVLKGLARRATQRS